MSALKWFEIRFHSGTWTRVHEYDMETVLSLYQTHTILSVEEVANGAGDKLR